MADHWTNKYIGREHVDGEYDCASLVVDVCRDEFGYKINLPVQRVHYEAGKNFNADIDYYRLTLAEPVEIPQDGDAVLMNNFNHLSHIGIYTKINDVAYVLHNMVKRNTCLHRVRDLHKFHLTVEGYYRLRQTPDDTGETDKYVSIQEKCNDTNRPQQASATSSG